MKPKEFDDLIRSKFDQNDFEFNPANWERLATQLDKKPGKRRMFLWLPLTLLASTTSIAAALAVVISLPGIFNRDSAPATTAQVTKKISVYNKTIRTAPKQLPVAAIAMNESEPTPINTVKVPAVAHANKVIVKDIAFASPVLEEQKVEKVTAVAMNSSKIPGTFKTVNHTEQRQIQADRGFDFYATPEEDDKQSTAMISIASGVNYGAKVSGYAVGAGARKMLNDKVYVEGDIAFVKSSTTEKIGYMSTAVNNDQIPMSAKTPAIQALTRSVSDGSLTSTSPSNASLEIKESSYSMYYAQITPSVGYNVRKNLSVGFGADVQRLLQNGRPPSASDNAESIKSIPDYDLGLIGKTEFALSKKVKMDLLYRQGITNFVNTTNRYIDRTYTQVQIKYTIFNK